MFAFSYRAPGSLGGSIHRGGGGTASHRDLPKPHMLPQGSIRSRHRLIHRFPCFLLSHACRSATAAAYNAGKSKPRANRARSIFSLTVNVQRPLERRVANTTNRTVGNRTCAKKQASVTGMRIRRGRYVIVQFCASMHDGWSKKFPEAVSVACRATARRPLAK